MSHIKAYICDYCKAIRGEDDIIGIIPREDMFEKMKSYPTTTKLDTTNLHCCMQCYRQHVLDPAEQKINRKHNENGYILKIEELGYMLRQTIVTRSVSQSFKKDKK